MFARQEETAYIFSSDFFIFFVLTNKLNPCIFSYKLETHENIIKTH